MPLANARPTPAPVSLCRPRPETIACFATALIATKPAKPCDGGVFGAFYLLLFLKRNRALGRELRDSGFGLWMQVADCELQLRLQTSGPKTALPQPGLRHAFHTPKTRKRIASNPQPLPAP